MYLRFFMVVVCVGGLVDGWICTMFLVFKNVWLVVGRVRAQSRASIDLQLMEATPTCWLTASKCS